jgi:hypothetical protein
MTVRVLLLALVAAAAFAACDGDDGGGDGPASQTPFIAPSPYTTEEALRKLDEVELLIKLPDPQLTEEFDISTTELQQRVTLILEGTSDTSGLDDARAALEDENRILATEYIYNTVTDYVVPSFGPDDSDIIDEETLDEIDPGHTFVEDHSQGMFTTGVFKEATIALIELWYRALPGD